MAAVIRTSAARFGVQGNLLSKSIAKQLPCVQHVSGISSKVIRDLNGVKRPPPYDYRNKRYNLWYSLFDRTTHRIDENSKIILVEGPNAVGKAKFAEELAKELDMLYKPQSTMDNIYINSYGYDLRELDKELPPGARSFDEWSFLANPKDSKTAALQLNMYTMRYYEYIEALGHVLSTGQGVVLNRSIFSDIVFLESIYRHQLITKLSYNGLHDVRNNTSWEVLRPHLVIYLDVPVESVLEKTKKRNTRNEANSPLFEDTKFLATMEDVYKNVFLKDITSHAELLVYDWTNGGEIELVVEDIERIDFNRFEKEDTKMKDWRFMPLESDWAEMRMKYTSYKNEIAHLINVPLFHCPDLCIDPDDIKAQEDAWDEAPGMQYALGYNAHLGDTKILTKTKQFLNDGRRYF